mgnify:CR=1 FL=1
MTGPDLEYWCMYNNLAEIDKIFDANVITEATIYMIVSVAQTSTVRHVLDKLAPIKPNLLRSAFHLVISTPCLRLFKLLKAYGARYVEITNYGVASLLSSSLLGEFRKDRLEIIRSLCAMDEATKELVLGHMSVVDTADTELIFAMIELGASIYSVSRRFNHIGFRSRIQRLGMLPLVRRLDIAIMARDPLFTTMYYRCDRYLFRYRRYRRC